MSKTKLKQLDASGATDGQVATYDIASDTWGPETPSGGAPGIPVMFEAYQAATGVSWVTTTFVDITLDTEREKSPDFLFTPGDAFSEITVAGKFVVIGRIAYQQFAGNNRTNCRMRLMVDSGAGFVEVPGSRSYAYSRNTANGEDNMISTCILDLAIGDRVKMQAALEAGVGDCRVIADGASLVMFSTIGASGAAGPSGPSGADGVDGADGVAAIAVSDEGTELTPAVVAMDFVGAGVVVTEPTANNVVVTIGGAPRRHTFAASGQWQANDTQWHSPRIDTGPNDPIWDKAWANKTPDFTANGFYVPFDCTVIGAEIGQRVSGTSSGYIIALVRHRKTPGATTVANAQIGTDTNIQTGEPNEWNTDPLDISVNTSLLAGDYIVPMAQLNIAVTHQLFFNLNITVEAA